MMLRLINKKNEVGNVKSFIFEPEEPIEWIAGQYLIYNLDHENKDLRGKMRFFTISSSPFEKLPTITTRIFDDSSTFKKALDNLQIGDKINAKGPDGDFVAESSDEKYVFIAGGIGINPFMSIVKQLDHDQKKINITLYYSNHSPDILFKDELLEIAKRHKGFKINFIFRPQRIDKKFLEKHLDELNTKLIYVSGPDPMVEEVEKALEEIGIEKAKIKSDYFSGYKF